MATYQTCPTTPPHPPHTKKRHSEVIDCDEGIDDDEGDEGVHNDEGDPGIDDEGGEGIVLLQHSHVNSTRQRRAHLLVQPDELLDSSVINRDDTGPDCDQDVQGVGHVLGLVVFTVLPWGRAVSGQQFHAWFLQRGGRSGCCKKTVVVIEFTKNGWHSLKQLSTLGCISNVSCLVKPTVYKSSTQHVNLQFLHPPLHCCRRTQQDSSF